MSFNKFLTTIALWSITTTLNFTATIAHYLPKIKSIINTSKSTDISEPSIWKQSIFCTEKRVYITNYDFVHKFRKLIMNPTKVFVTKDGRYYYNSLECETYGPIIIVGVTATIVASALLFKLWKFYQQTPPTNPPSITPEQQTFLTTDSEHASTPPFQAACNDESITALLPFPPQNKIASHTM